MLNQTIQIKVQQRLNKLASSDFDDIPCWQVVEAFNKGQVEWCRRQLAGTNILQQGDEESERRIDDLNILLKSKTLTMTHHTLFDESQSLTLFTGDDYMAFKRLEVYASSECCKDPRLMVIYLVEEANAINYLTDDDKKPSFEWGETFATIVGRKIRIYTGGTFQVDKASLMYYKQPRRIVIQGCADPYTGVVNAPANIIPEFKDDICELLVDEAASILAGDMENFNQVTRESQNAEHNN